MKKTIKKSLPLLLLCGSLLASCGGGDSASSTTTVIKLYNFSGGVGEVWLNNAIERFQTANAETSFEEGKKGVTISFYGNTDAATATGSMKSASEAVYFTEKGDSPYTLANKGLAYDITELVQSKASESESKTIESKIDADYRDSLKGEDGHYYALPHYEWYPGLTYDKSVFGNSRNPYYFAAPDETSVNEYTAKVTVGETEYNFGSGRFIADATGKKSCGNDGLYGTEDDGLPTSIQEFLILCSYLSSNNVYPLAVAGNHHDYTAYLLEGILTALVGKEGVQNYFDFDGTMDVVTGYDSSTSLFSSNSGIAAPITETKTLSDSTGYLTRQSKERYYLVGLMKTLLDCGFFTNKSVNSSTNNLLTQKGFILGKDGGYGEYASAMLVEGNYWYNEAKAEGYFDSYKKTAKKDREIGWMSLPSKIEGTVSEDETGVGYKTPLLDTGNSYCIVNKAVMDRGTEGFRKAVTEFVKFLYTDSELQSFTATTGTAKAAIDYDYTASSVEDNLSEFQKSVLALKKNNGVVYTKTTSSVFRRHQGDFIFSIEAPLWKTSINNISYSSYLDAFNAKGKNYTAQQVFEGAFITADAWKSGFVDK